MQKQFQKYRAYKGLLPLLVCFYLLALLQLPVLELGHMVSHSINGSEAKGHSHMFFRSHQKENSLKSLEAMAGHDHNMLETLKLVLEIENQTTPKDEVKVSFKLDKHIPQQSWDGNDNGQGIYTNVFRFLLPSISSPIIGQEIPPPELS
ncbi:hypothetical protein [Flavobacterium sp. ASW18X]|uniref:hypothetical protein n=1 Tax=Flavobacterium sp. ASW18X TaxID=2572595 RepID=UPI0010AE5F6E|nr:hypothetical protein [Flavobacterium sp. ASW18X]TKD66544.1 hypothetical protein FBT53_01430 [Flavobacterium sp. ASW18X]